MVTGRNTGALSTVPTPLVDTASVVLVVVGTVALIDFLLVYFRSPGLKLKYPYLICTLQRAHTRLHLFHYWHILTKPAGRPRASRRISNTAAWKFRLLHYWGISKVSIDWFSGEPLRTTNNPVLILTFISGTYVFYDVNIEEFHGVFILRVTLF